MNKLFVKIKVQTNNSGIQIPFYPLYLIVPKAANFLRRNEAKLLFRIEFYSKWETHV